MEKPDSFDEKNPAKLAKSRLDSRTSTGSLGDSFPHHVENGVETWAFNGPKVGKNAGFARIGEKVVHHQARKYGTTKFGLNRFVNGYLDLLSLWFISKFGGKPMHIFGFLGSIMFLIGLVSAIVVGSMKLCAMYNGMPYRLVTDSPYFYIALTMMLLGSQFFLAGFIGELIARNAEGRNSYQIREEI